MMDNGEYRLLKLMQQEEAARVTDNRPAAERIQSQAAQRRLKQMQKKREKNARKLVLATNPDAEAKE